MANKREQKSTKMINNYIEMGRKDFPQRYKKLYSGYVHKLEIGNILNKMGWHIWFTGTFRDRYIRKWEARERLMNFLFCIKEKEIVKYWYCYFIEFQGMKDVPHIHALLYFRDDIKWWENREEKHFAKGEWWKDEMQIVYWNLRWEDRNGKPELEKYDKKLGACWYLKKKVIQDYFCEGEWGFDEKHPDWWRVQKEMEETKGTIKNI